MKIAIIAVAVIVAAVLGLGMSGKINIPGISPAPKKKKAAKAKEPEAAKPVAEIAVKPAAKPPAPPAKKPSANVETVDPELGAKRVAKLWNEIETAALARIVTDWKDGDLVVVLAKMDNAKVAELLALIPDRASSLSRELQRMASIVPAPVEG